MMGFYPTVAASLAQVSCRDAANGELGIDAAGKNSFLDRK